MDRETDELLNAARATAQEAQELVDQSQDQIAGIGDRLRLLSWCGEQVRIVLSSFGHTQVDDGGVGV